MRPAERPGREIAIKERYICQYMISSDAAVLRKSCLKVVEMHLSWTDCYKNKRRARDLESYEEESPLDTTGTQQARK